MVGLKAAVSPRAKPGQRIKLRVELVVIGDGFVQRAIPLAARVGTQEVEGIEVRSDGQSFSRLLERAPSPGDRPAVGYLDEGLQPTSIVYRGGDRPVA